MRPFRHPASHPDAVGGPAIRHIAGTARRSRQQCRKASVRTRTARSFPFDPARSRPGRCGTSGPIEVPEFGSHGAIAYRVTRHHTPARPGVAVRCRAPVRRCAGKRSTAWMERDKRRRPDGASDYAFRSISLVARRSSRAHTALATCWSPATVSAAAGRAPCALVDPRRCLIAESVLRVGHAAAPRLLRWYGAQVASGRARLRRRARGDPWRTTAPVSCRPRGRGSANQDRRLSRRWAAREAAARFRVARQSERTSHLRPPPALLGCPASISNEGSRQARHSYWDDFWALKGYHGAVAMAAALGQADALSRLERQRDEFWVDLAASLRHATVAHGIAYLPGAAELGDFDPTSSTIAIAPGGELHRLPRELVVATFERYWDEFVARRDGRRAWEDYTPYEIRTVGTFVRPGVARPCPRASSVLPRRSPVPGGLEPVARVGRPRSKAAALRGDMPHAGWPRTSSGPR